MSASGDPTTLLTTELQGIEGMEVNIVLFEEEPGKVFGRHIHPGNLFVYVLDGSLRVEIEGQEPREAKAGEVIHEVPDKPMVASVTGEEGVRFVVFQIGPIGEPIMVSQPE
ncbi:cupin domain-containing protein [Halomonas maura]|uniref:cupin domain-containing protein n=1 Tax=Halomonas maura TaxID=117606 RepID=UPI0025B2E6B4|nr:cupin domain-containing protein [Halomonas maura]MDN3558084.1 cupin domain-containing protein [Halomonas maura]